MTDHRPDPQDPYASADSAPYRWKTFEVETVETIIRRHVLIVDRDITHDSPGDILDMLDEPESYRSTDVVLLDVTPMTPNE